MTYVPQFMEETVRMKVIVVVLGLCLLFASVACMACVGARPLAMGGAFIGLADDANATYWNPAGLALLSKPEATWMHTTTNRDEINYQDYLAYATKLQNNGMGLGFSYIGYNLLGVEDQSWFWVSGAYPFKGGYAGLNVKFVSDSMDGVDTDMGIDLSFLRQINEKWSAGVLIQNLNEPVTQGGPDRLVWKRNIRPGVAYRYDHDTVLTADIYDILDSCDAFALRFGAERILKNGLAVRAGYYGISGGGAFTFGAGGKVGRTQVDAALMTGDLDNTVLLSATNKF